MSPKSSYKRGKDTSYPESRDVVEKGLNHKRKSALDKGKVLRVKEISDATGIPIASLWNYTKGLRIPTAESARKMGIYFYGKDSPAAESFARTIEKLRIAAAIPVRRADVLDQLDTAQSSAGSGQLSFVSCTFPPFSGDQDCFLDGLVARMVKSGGLTSRSEKREEKDSPDFDVRTALTDDKVHLALGYCATVERSVNMHCWNTPFKICLSAIVNRKDKDEDLLRRVEKALLADREPRGQHPPLHVFVLRQDIGATYMQSLNLEGVTTVVMDDFQSLRDSMENFSQGKETPVAVINEFTGFKLLREINGVPVMPLSSRRAATQRKKLPAYYLSIACDRQQDPGFRDLIEQMLVLFLGTDVESTSSALAVSLWPLLMAEVKQSVPFYHEEAGADSREGKSIRFNYAYHWTLYNLGLDHFSLDNYLDSVIPWKPILKRTRELILQALCKEEDTIRNQIALIVGNEDDALSRKKLHEVQEALDIELKLNSVQEQYTREDRGILVRAIENAAEGMPVGLPIEEGKKGGFVDVFPVRKELLRVIDGYLAELGIFYRTRISQEDIKVLGIKNLEDGPVNRITGFRYAVRNEDEKTKSCRVILATIGKKTSPLYIGGAFVRPYDDHGGNSLELMYLWTHPQYRTLGVAGCVIRRAIQHAEEDPKYSFLVVEIFRTLNDQVTYFQKQGFKYHGENKETGRVVLSYALKQG